MTTPMTPAECNLTHKHYAASAPDTAAVLLDAHTIAIAQRALPIWCVTHDPSDLPGLYVARLHITKAGSVYVTTIAATGDTLESVRSVLPPGLIRFDRAPQDEPQIVETWL